SSLSCLNTESWINTRISASDRAAAIAGRRSTASQKKLSSPQVKRKIVFGTMPISVSAMTIRAARGKIATSAALAASRRAIASKRAGRVTSDAGAESMAAGRPCPATSTLYSGAQPRRHKTVFKLSFQAVDANLSISTKGMARITRRKIDSAILVVSVAKYTVKRRGPGGNLYSKPDAYAFDCSTRHRRKGSAADAPHRRSPYDRDTRVAASRSNVQRYHFAMVIQERSAGRGCPSP